MDPNREEQVTSAPHGHILTNTGVWSPDSRRIVYDVRSDPAGERFDGDRIESVDVRTRATRVLYRSTRGARCGVVTWHPREERVVFIHGPEDPTPDWRYGPARRRGVLVDAGRPGTAVNLDARDLAPSFTPGALRGGTHVHVFRPCGRLVSFTYQDAVLEARPAPEADPDQRNVGVTLLGRPVTVDRDHPRNHDGAGFSVLVTRTTARPRPGSDEISRAYEDAWVGTDGYLRPDGTRQRLALAFLGDVTDGQGRVFPEVFVADLPEDLTRPGDGPLEGTATRRPLPPRGTVQRRLTFTADRKHPGVQGPRHWVRSSPDGARVAFLARDDAGVVQIWTVSPNGGPPVQLTRNRWDIASAFTWSPDGRRLAHAMDGSVCVTDAATGETARLTSRAPAAAVPRPEACVFSPDGRTVAYVRPVPAGEAVWNQVFVCRVPPARP